MKALSKQGVVAVMFVAVLGMAGCGKADSKAKNVPAAPMPVQAVSADSGKLPKDVIVSVGDWVLTAADFDERVKNIKQAVPSFDDKDLKSRQMLIEELVRQELMVREAREQRLNESKEFRSAVKDFENNLMVQELVSGLTKDIKATETEAREYYDKNPEVFVKPVEKKVSVIEVAAESEAREINIQVLQSGADFAKIAKERSKGKTAANGGDLGYLSEMPFEAMDKVAATITKGGISGVFQGPDGYYIVKVDDVRGGDKASFDEIKADLINGLTSQKQQDAVLSKIAEAAKKVKVNMNAELLNTKTGE
jgi:peptidyl-prolyl cis-trans isomerase C